jgi:hypothetical protein
VNDNTRVETNSNPMTPETSTGELHCPHCSNLLDPQAYAAEGECAVCRSRLRIALFPAFTHPPEAVSTASGERALEGEAACYFHAEKRATVSCERCGRFLCALCDMPFAGRHLCPACLDASKVPDLVGSRWVGGEMAALLGVGPLIFCLPAWPLLPFAGGAAVFIALWTWKKPGSLVHGQRHGLAIFGLIGGLLQLAITAGLIFSIVYAIRHD